MSPLLRGLCAPLWLISACRDSTVIVGKLPSPAPVGRTVDAGSADRNAADGVTSSGAGTSAAPTSDAGTAARNLVSIESGALSDFCRRTGSALSTARVTASPADCAARVERRVFAYGLCACDALKTDSEAFTNTTLIVSAENQRIARGLWTAAEIVVQQGSLRVDRDVYQLPGHNPLGTLGIGGQHYSANEFRVTAPCSCGAIDVAALAAQSRDHNDNAAVSFDPDALDIDSLITDVNTLPCGRLHASTLTLRGPDTYGLSSDSRSALFIQGDLKFSTLSTLSSKRPTEPPFRAFWRGTRPESGRDATERRLKTRPQTRAFYNRACATRLSLASWHREPR